MRLQEKLQDLDFLDMAITPNGVFGLATQKAVIAFQKASKLKQTGSVDSKTIDALNGEAPEAPAPPPPPPPVVSGDFKKLLTMGSRGDEVRMLQDKLKDLGFLATDIDSTGIFGKLTASAVKAFQKANGISAVGFVGPGTRAALNSM